MLHAGLDYVLLGGDTEVVPHRSVYGECSIDSDFVTPGIQPTKDNTIPCDLYFSDLDGDWDVDDDGGMKDGLADNPKDDLNGGFGELSDGVEMHPDVYVGRAPVNTVSEADNFIWKGIFYEQGLIDLSKVKNVLFAAEKLSATCDAKVAKSWINPNIYDFNTNGFTVTGLYESDGTEDEDSVFNALNGGNLIANIYGHGSEVSMAVGSGTNQLISDDSGFGKDIKTLSNSLTPFILYSLGCHSGAFDNVYLAPGDDCISEEFLKVVNGGAVAMISGSRAGLYNGASVNGSGKSWDYDCEFFNSLFAKGIYNLGKAFADSKEQYAELSKTSSDNRWMQYCLNLLGDPEMVVWTGYLDDITAAHSGTTDYTEVNVTNPVQAGVNVCVVNGSNVYRALTNNNGKVIVPVPYNAADQVTVTSHNYIPDLKN